MGSNIRRNALQSYLHCSDMALLFEPLWVLQFEFKKQIWMVLVFKIHGPCKGFNLDVLIMGSFSQRFGLELPPRFAQISKSLGSMAAHLVLADNLDAPLI